MIAIYKRELKSYFTGMMGYVFVAFVLLFIGIYTAAINLKYAYPGFEYVLKSATFMYLIAVPVLTIAEPDDCLARDLIEALFAQRGIALAPEVAAYIVPRMERSF